MKSKIIFITICLGFSLFMNAGVEARTHISSGLTINLVRPQVVAPRIVETRVVETRVVTPYYNVVQPVVPVREVVPVYVAPVQRTVIHQVYQAPAPQPRSNFWFSLFLKLI